MQYFKKGCHNKEKMWAPHPVQSKGKKRGKTPKKKKVFISRFPVYLNFEYSFYTYGEKKSEGKQK